MSASGRCLPRPHSLNGTAHQALAPPVPRRRDSLPTPKNEARSSLPDRSIPTMSAIETVLDDPHTTYTFEAKSLWKDSFKTLYEFYQQGTLCDIIIKAGKSSFSCHRVVLACSGQYFRTMFTSEMSESRQASVTIKDIDEAALEALINFAYTSRITLSTDNVQTLLYASSILQVEIVAQACCEFMKSHLHPSNCIGIQTFAEQHGRLELMKRADTYILDHFSDVVHCDEFLGMGHGHLEAMLASPDLNVNSEVEVYEATIRWIKHNIERRRIYIPKLIGHIRLPLLPPTYLMDTVAKEEMLRKNLECRDYLDEAKSYQLSIAQVVPGMKLSMRMRPRKSYAGVIFCVGGRGSSGDPFKTIECYDLRKNRWFPVAEMSCRRRHVGVVSVNGKLYAVGGHDGSEHLNTGELFDPVTNKWRPLAPMSTLRRGIAMACLGGPIYAVGGLDDSTCFNIVERYDPDSDTWSFVQPMTMPRGGVAIATLKGLLYAIGGNDGTSSLDTCERYDPHLNKWSLIANMNKRRAGAGVAELNRKLYVVGGFDDNSPLDSVEQFDPCANAWTIITKMSCPRGGVGVAALAGKIYAVGGHDGTNYLSTVEAYDPLNNTWEIATGISSCRAGAGIAVVKCRTENLKDITKVNLAPTVEGPQRVAPQGMKCIVRCSIYARGSIHGSNPLALHRVGSEDTQSIASTSSTASSLSKSLGSRLSPARFGIIPDSAAGRPASGTASSSAAGSSKNGAMDSV